MKKKIVHTQQQCNGVVFSPHLPVVGDIPLSSERAHLAAKFASCHRGIPNCGPSQVHVLVPDSEYVCAASFQQFHPLQTSLQHPLAQKARGTDMTFFVSFTFFFNDSQCMKHVRKVRNFDFHMKLISNWRIFNVGMLVWSFVMTWFSRACVRR